MKRFKAFTLAEIIAVVIILGVVAAITVPTTVKRTTERQNKTKILKAMAAYENMIQQVAINEGINSLSELKNWAKTSTSIEQNATNSNGEDIVQTYTTYDCSNVIRYFNISNNKQTSTGNEHSKRRTDNNCTKIHTSDGLWWNLSDISKPIVAFKEENLTAAKAQDLESNDAFYFIATWPENARTPVANATEYLNISDVYELMDKLNNATRTDIGANGNASTVTMYGGARTNDMLYMKKLYDYVGQKFRPGNVDNFCTTEKCCQAKSGSCIEMYQDPYWGYYYPHQAYYVDRYGYFANMTAEYSDENLSKYSLYSRDTGYKIEIDINNKIGKVSLNGTNYCYNLNFDSLTAKEASSLSHGLHCKTYGIINEETCSGYTKILNTVDCE